jgi:hypothetical protein
METMPNTSFFAILVEIISRATAPGAMRDLVGPAEFEPQQSNVSRA